MDVISIMNSLIKKRYVNQITDIEVKNKIREFKVETELIKELSCLDETKMNRHYTLSPKLNTILNTDHSKHTLILRKLYKPLMNSNAGYKNKV